MKRHVFTLILAAAVLLLIGTTVTAQETKKEDVPAKTFTLVKELPRLPAISQGGTGTCWSFSATSFMETELQRLGKKAIDLSELYTVHQVYLEKAERFIRTQGNNTFAEGGFSHDLLWVMKTYGAVPAEVYTGLWKGEEGHNHGELSRGLRAYLEAVLKAGRGGPSIKWRAGFSALLDAYLGVAPEKFTWEGVEYTPRTFADIVLGLNPDDYIQITSYKYLPWYGKGEHVIPDNWAHNKDFYNLPLDDFMNAFDYALRNGYSVVVSTDMSEKGFNQKIGYAVLESDKDGVKPVTQDEREKSWDDWSTTDDHGMHAVGVATDEKGEVYYLVKNSWGADADKTGPYAGHIYMSQNFLRGKMHTFMVHKDGIPAELRAKLGIK